MPKLLTVIIFLYIFMIAGCENSEGNKINNVGLLVPDTVNDQVWGTKGYKGMLKIQSNFNVDVFLKEGMNNEAVVKVAVEDLSAKGVNLIFGHGNEYVEYFNKIAPQYPNIHFIYFNGDAVIENITSLNFEANAMGFFGGMVAGKMTQSNKVGVIAAFDWQPEVDGFFEGALFQTNDEVEVKVEYVQNWNDIDLALQVVDRMISEGVDVVYPAGDGFNVPVIERLKENGLYAIGYVSDQSDLGQATVLTSTVQNVDILYELVAERYNDGTLESGNLYFDFQDEVITMGVFSPKIDQAYQKKINSYIQIYKDTGKLPNQIE
ncbi:MULTISPECIES: BMP family ABC transporter substrate-binding protein [Bacillaceae]|uniref:BMP family ABC transporter substrate-binding protein n=1 Tax=Bacillaceae TaxID=186817 RepID=UPI002A138930|nr:BMP family ABC transporter substrate-binding protein [Cytobacillus sp. IB215316]MDX8361410.1 BMP family ABC transporter substrate-binding protein [Cytobacillus sp. IB215316]